MTKAALSLASFFTIEAREYANFSFDASARTTLRNVIFGFCIGILVASLYMLYQKLIPGGIVRAILRADAFSAESAKSLAELGLDKNPLYRFELRHNAVLKKLVHCTSEPKGDGDNAKGNTEQEQRFYISEEEKYRAEVRFDKKGNGVAGLLITAVLTVGLAILLIKLAPAVLGMVDHFLK